MCVCEFYCLSMPVCVRAFVRMFVSVSIGQFDVVNELANSLFNEDSVVSSMVAGCPIVQKVSYV